MITLNKINKINDSLEIRENIIDYIASELNTIPIYLYFPEGIPDLLEENINIEVVDILSLIIKNSKENNLINLLDNLPPLDKLKLNFEDIIKIFIAYVEIDETYITNEYDQLLIINSAFLSIKHDENYKDIKFSTDMNSYWLDRKNIQKNIQKMINLNKKNIQKILEIHHELLLTKGIKYTNLELQSIKFSLKFNIENFSIMEIFNYLQLNNRIPYACVNNTYKIFKNFDINYFSQKSIEDWSNEIIENKILLRVLHTNNTEDTKTDDYTLTLIKINEGILEVQTDNLNLNDKNITKDVFIENILNILPELNLKTYKYIEEENEIKTVFYFPNWNQKEKKNLNIYVLSDLIMNDNLFFNFLSINESIKATKSKDYVHIYFKNFIIGNITATITEKVSKIGDNDIKNKDIENNFKYGSYYIRILCKGKNRNSIIKFQTILSKLLYIYQNRYNKIIKEYKKFGVNIASTSSIRKLKKKRKERKTLSDKNSQREPNVFFKNWNQNCSIGPTIVNDDMLSTYPHNSNWNKGDPVEIIIKNIWYPGWVIKKNSINNTFDVEYYKFRSLEDLKEGNRYNLKDIKNSVTDKEIRSPPIFFDKKLKKYVMKYPIEKNINISPVNYVCNHSKNIYPGLYIVKNQKLNDSGYFYLPCCYSKDPLLKSKQVNGIKQYFYKQKKKKKRSQSPFNKFLAQVIKL